MSFDADTFLHTTVDQANETAFQPVPEDEYEAIVNGIDIRQAKDNTILEVTWDILNDALRTSMNRDKVTVRQSVFLDIADNGTLAMGPNTNIQLGRLRDALGQNTAAPWSPSDLIGAGPAWIKVIHRENKNDPDNPYAGVQRVAATQSA